jgi:hypothetical protein
MDPVCGIEKEFGARLGVLRAFVTSPKKILTGSAISGF